MEYDPQLELAKQQTAFTNAKAILAIPELQAAVLQGTIDYMGPERAGIEFREVPALLEVIDIDLGFFRENRGAGYMLWNLLLVNPAIIPPSAPEGQTAIAAALRQGIHALYNHSAVY
jgi:hypothetical protein